MTASPIIEFALTYGSPSTLEITIIHPDTSLDYPVLLPTSVPEHWLRDFSNLLATSTVTTVHPWPDGRDGWLWQLHQPTPP